MVVPKQCPAHFLGGEREPILTISSREGEVPVSQNKLKKKTFKTPLEIIKMQAVKLGALMEQEAFHPNSKMGLRWDVLFMLEPWA